MKQLSIHPLAALAGIAGALIGWLLIGLLADLLLGLGGMSDREGGPRHDRLLHVRPVRRVSSGSCSASGWCSAIAGAATYGGGYRSLPALAGRGALVGAGVAAAVGLGLWAYMLSDDLLVHNALSPQVKFELRLPANAALPDNLAGLSIDLNTDKNTMPAALTEAHKGGRTVDLYFRTSGW